MRRAPCWPLVPPGRAVTPPDPLIFFLCEVLMRKILGWLVLAFVVFYAVSNPADAAGVLRSVASGIGEFAAALAGGGQ